MRILAKLAAVTAGLFITMAGAQAAVSVRIDLSSQRMQVTNGKGESYNWAISSGRSGFNTPRGSYAPQSLRRMHYSSKYNNSPMPYSIFFRGGYAIHGTGAVGMLGRPASHGCVRLATGNAAKLFSMVQREGARISISGSPPHMIAKKKGKKNTAFAGRRTKANPLAYAPTKRQAAPTVRQFQRNPVGQ